MDWVEKNLARIRNRAGYCGLCADVLRDYVGHVSRGRPQCKAHPDSRVLNEAEWARLEAEVMAEGEDPKGARERRVAAAKKRQAEAWKPPAGDQPEQEYRMNFGKHSGGKGKTIGEVMADDPQYFRHLLSGDSNMLDSKPDLKQALEKAGILAALMSERPRAQAEHAARVVARDEKEKGQGVRLHPEVGKLRQLQMIEASEVIAQGISDGGMAEALALASQGEPAPPKKRRVYAPTARVLLPHCAICGNTSHKRTSCPHKDLQGKGLPELRPLVMVAHQKNKRMAALVSRIKYTRIATRSQAYESRPTQSSRAPQSREFLSYCRATPEDLCNLLEEDGLLLNLHGVPCPRQQCLESTTEGYVSSTKSLGKRTTVESGSRDVNFGTVYYRCQCCRQKYSVGLHNPVFDGFLGGGSKGISYALFAMWNCVQGISIAATVRQLKIGEDLCRRYFDRATVIMAAEAHWRQGQIVWGTGTSKTVEVELDCTVICKWRRVEDGHMVYYYYCYMGARQRGSVDKLALMPLGVSRSVDEGRVNPEGPEAYHRFCKEVFGDQELHLISMSDGAGCYTCRCEICVRIFKEHYAVNHSRRPVRENSRPLGDMLLDVCSGERGVGMAGTMTVDKEWDLLKDPLPRGLSAATDAAMARCDLLVRAQQFRRMVSTGDTWAAFLEGARRWMAAQTASSAPKVVALGKMGGKLAESLRARRRAASGAAGTEALTSSAAAGEQPLQNQPELPGHDSADRIGTMVGVPGVGQCRPHLDEGAAATPLWRTLESLYNLPPDVVTSIFTGLSEYFGPEGAMRLFQEQWLSELERWVRFTVVVQKKRLEAGDGAVLPLLVDELRAVLFAVARCARQNSSVPYNLDRSDEEHLAGLVRRGYSCKEQGPGGRRNIIHRACADRNFLMFIIGLLFVIASVVFHSFVLIILWIAVGVQWIL
jgi:hypothetical protein